MNKDAEVDGKSKEDRDLTRFKLRVLVADDTVFNQKILAMTASSADEDKERCMVSGMDGYVPKPIASD